MKLIILGFVFLGYSSQIEISKSQVLATVDRSVFLADDRCKPITEDTVDIAILETSAEDPEKKLQEEVMNVAN